MAQTNLSEWSSAKKASVNGNIALYAGVFASILCGAALALGGPIAVLLAAAAMIALFLFTRPFAILCVLLSLIAFEAINAIQPRELYTITIAKVVGGLLVVSLLPYFIKGKMHIKSGLVVGIIGVFLLCGLASFLKAVNYTAAVSSLFTFIQLGILFVVVGVLVTNIERLRVLGKVAVLTLSVSALIGIGQYITDPTVRIIGVSQNAAVLSADLYVALWFGIALMLTTKVRAAKTFWAIVIAIISLGLLFSLSRAAYIAFIPSVAAAGFFWGRPRHTLAILAVVLILIVFFAPFTLRRLAETGVEDRSTRGHIYSIQTGINIFLDNPFIGIGIGNYPEHYLRYTSDVRGAPRTPHNAYLGIASEMGIFALGAYLAMNLMAFHSLWIVSGRLKEKRDYEGLIFIGIIAGALTAFFVMNIFHSLQISKYLWVLFALAIQFPWQKEPIAGQ